ncbi:MAG TPA: hypothetical protein VD928_02445 [Candidatus Paceibacterota bacterium]|nr:hypothetical protein [Candidatus Paceibacterota bacterium]
MSVKKRILLIALCVLCTYIAVHAGDGIYNLAAGESTDTTRAFEYPLRARIMFELGEFILAAIFLVIPVLLCMVGFVTFIFVASSDLYHFGLVWLLTSVGNPHNNDHMEFAFLSAIPGAYLYGLVRGPISNHGELWHWTDNWDLLALAVLAPLIYIAVGMSIDLAKYLINAIQSSGARVNNG